MNRKDEAYISVASIALAALFAWLVDPWLMRGELHRIVPPIVSRLDVLLFSMARLIWAHPFLNIPALLVFCFLLDVLKNASDEEYLRNERKHAQYYSRHAEKEEDKAQHSEDSHRARKEEEKAQRSDESKTSSTEDRASDQSTSPRSRMWWEILLEVDPSSSSDAIKASFRKKAKETHADTGSGDTEAFRKFREAYDAAKKAGRVS